MKYEITKSFRFEAMHSLPHLPTGHQCRRDHGHSYEIIVGVSGPLKGEWLMDYAEISQIARPIIDQLDHQNLNKILRCPTTAENLARWLWAQFRNSGLKQISRIEVRETPTSNVILTK